MYNPQQPTQQLYTPSPLISQQPTYQQPDPTTYSKEAAIVAKIYTDSQKYNGVSKSLNFKLAIFKDIYRRASL